MLTLDANTLKSTGLSVDAVEDFFKRQGELQVDAKEHYDFFQRFRVLGNELAFWADQATVTSRNTQTWENLVDGGDYVEQTVAAKQPSIILPFSPKAHRSFDGGDDYMAQKVHEDQAGAIFWPTNAGACFNATNARFRVAGVDLSAFASAANDYMLVIHDSSGKTAWGYIDVADDAEALGGDLFDEYKGTFDLVNLRLSELSTGNLTLGTIYEISDQTDEDFTADGAPDNIVGTTFIATATTVDLDDDDKVYPLNISWKSYAPAGCLIAIDNNALKITYANDSIGAELLLRDAADLSSDFIIGNLYKLTLDTKVDDGNSIDIAVDMNYGVSSTLTITETSFVSKTFYFIATHANYDRIRTLNMSEGEIIWLDNIVLKEVTHVGTDGVLIMSTKGGSTQSWAYQEAGIDLNDIDSFEVLKTDFQITGDLTVIAWGKNPDADDVLVSKWDSSHGAIDLYLDASGFAKFAITTDGTTLKAATDNADISDDAWHMVFGIFKASTHVKVGVDGIVENTNTTAIPASIYDSWVRFILGGRFTAGSVANFWNGEEQAIVIFSRALSVAETALIDKVIAISGRN